MQNKEIEVSGNWVALAHVQKHIVDAINFLMEFESGKDCGYIKEHLQDALHCVADLMTEELAEKEVIE